MYWSQLIDWLMSLSSSVRVLGVFTITLIVFFVSYKVLWQRMVSMAARTKTGADDALLRALRTPSKFIVLWSSALFAGLFLPESVRQNSTFVQAAKVSAVLLAAWIAHRSISVFLSSDSGLMRISQTMRSLLLTLFRLVLVSITGLVVLDNLGISITPILASLGVGSVAVALALQDTLTNFFGGLYLLIDEPIRIGDFVQVETGIEGHVVKVGWRSTQIRMLSNNIVVIPNSKIASQRLINYDLPESEAAVVVQVGVSYSSDLDHVERVTQEVAAEVLSSVEGAVSSFKPFIRFHTFADSSINFSVILRARQINDQYLIKHEFIKLLQKRYISEGISIPFPQRDVRVINEKK